MDGKSLRRKITTCCLLVFLALTFILQKENTAEAYTGNGSTVVHITETGACYHKDGCGALRSDITITLEDAYIKGYQPCDRCDPPIYTGQAIHITEKEVHRSTGNSFRESGVIKKAQKVTSEPNPLPWLIIKYSSICILIIGVSVVAAMIIIKRIKASKEIKRETISRQQEYEARKKNYEENYKGRSIREIIGAPDDISIDRNGKVVRGTATKQEPYGDLTVFISYSGQRYHRSYSCRKSYGVVPVNIYDAVIHGYSPCYYCGGAPIRVPEWYLKIHGVIRVFDEFEPTGKPHA